MAATAQYFFGYRVTSLLGLRRPTYLVIDTIVPLNWALGISMSVLSYLWAARPFGRQYTLFEAKVRHAAAFVPLAWLALSALIDAAITFALTIDLLRLSTSFARTKRVTYRLLRLTFETVGVTHAICATTALLDITSWTHTDAFCFCLALVAELFALSILFTLNSRASLKRSLAPSTWPDPLIHATPSDRHGRQPAGQRITIVDGPEGQLVCVVKEGPGDAAASSDSSHEI